MAMAGFRPVVEMQFDAFAYPAFEQIASHVAKMRNRTRGAVNLPIVIRVPYAGGIGGVEHHCDSSEAYYAHTPGLKVVTPATVEDAYSLLREAIADPDPVVFLEPKRLYWSKAAVELPVSGAPFGTAAVRREGRDATLIAYGPSVPVALEAAEAAQDEGWDVEVVDLRTIVPFDDETVVRLGAADRAVRRDPGGTGLRRCRRRDRRPGAGALLPRAARPGAAGQPGSTSPTRRRSSSTSTCPASTGSSTPIGRLQWDDARPALRRGWCGMSVTTASSAEVFLLPDLGEGLTEAEIVAGSSPSVTRSSSTRSSSRSRRPRPSVDVPCPYAGRVHQLHGEPGQMLAVGAPLLSVATVGSTGDSDGPDAVAAERTSEQSAALAQYREEEQAGSGNVLDRVRHRREQAHAAAGGSAPAAARLRAAATAAAATSRRRPRRARAAGRRSSRRSCGASPASTASTCTALDSRVARRDPARRDVEAAIAARRRAPPALPNRHARRRAPADAPAPAPSPPPRGRPVPRTTCTSRCGACAGPSPTS